MGYHPLYDLNVDLTFSEGEFAINAIFWFLESVTKNKLTLTRWQTSGPGGGNPNVTLRGTRKQIASWINEYYDPYVDDYKAIDWVRSEADAWMNIVSAFSPTFVA